MEDKAGDAGPISSSVSSCSIPSSFPLVADHRLSWFTMPLSVPNFAFIPAPMAHAGIAAQSHVMSKLTRAIQWEFKALREFLSFRRPPERTFLNSLFMDDFVPVGETGMFHHKHKAGVFCGDCVTGHRVYARMNKSKGGWICFTCSKHYADPDGVLAAATPVV